MSHYEVLGLPVGASAAAIRKAYRQRAKHEHPDKGGSDEQFQKLQQAYGWVDKEQVSYAYITTGAHMGKTEQWLRQNFPKAPQKQNIIFWINSNKDITKMI